MARQESDREDLLRQATALVERIELAPLRNPQRERVVAGFRKGGAFSIFFGADPVYQFNTSGQLRRAYCAGLLIKAAGGRLVSLNRIRQQCQVQLVRNVLTDSEQHSFLRRMTELLHRLGSELQRGDYSVVGQVPTDSDMLGRLAEWLAKHDEFAVAHTPNVQGGTS